MVVVAGYVDLSDRLYQLLPTRSQHHLIDLSSLFSNPPFPYTALPFESFRSSILPRLVHHCTPANSVDLLLITPVETVVRLLPISPPPNMPHRHHHEDHSNEFLGKELKNFSQAGFDLDRIHIRVSRVSHLPFRSAHPHIGHLCKSRRMAY